MYNTSLQFQSIVRAQDFLKKAINSSNRNNPTCGIIAENPCKNNMSNISTAPVFKGHSGAVSLSNTSSLSNEVKQTFANISRRVYLQELISERGQETLEKAKKYNIPFNEDSIDWLALMDEIEEYEYLMSRADDLHLDWDYSHYDPAGLEEAIEDHLHDEWLCKQQEISNYYATR